MSDYMAAGGIFMWPLTLVGIAILGLIVWNAIDAFKNAGQSAGRSKAMLNLLLQLGIFSLMLGILSQAIGLMQALQAIEAAGDVSPSLIFGGLKVSMIAPVYGLMIFLVAFVAWSIFKFRADRLEVVS